MSTLRTVRQERQDWKHCLSTTKGLKEYAGDDHGQELHNWVWPVLHGLSFFEGGVFYLLPSVDWV